MLQPGKTKHKKAFKGRIRGNACAGTGIEFGFFGIKATEAERVKSNQIEAARKVINRVLKRKGRIWIRIFPNIPISKKPADVRMGKGKGSVEFWAFRVKPGRVLFEIAGVSREVAKEALLKGAAKLPIKCRFIENRYGGLR